MTLVERFIEINGWSTSRKTALLSALSLPTHLLGWLNYRVGVSSTGIMDVARLDREFALGTVALVFTLLASLAAARAGREGRWTAYLLVVLYGAFVLRSVQMAGTWSTPHFGFYPLLVMLILLYYGPRIGWFAFGYGLLSLAILGSLEAAGIMPYAPALLDRTVDAHRSAGWVSGVIFSLILVFSLSFVIGLLVLAAQKLQERRLEVAHRLIRRYVPSQLAEKIVKGEYLEAARPERVKLTIFFSDVEGFTDSSDSLDPEDLSAILNEYLSEMSEIAERYGATIDQFVGDGIMIFFGAPEFTSDRDHALRAVRMALEMQQRMLELKNAWVERGIRKPFRARIGINTGHASVGDFGSLGRKVYSAIGVQTNIAARIQANCEPGRVLISDSTWALVHQDIACVDQGELQLKGLHYAVRVYQVAEPSNSSRPIASS